MAGTANEFTEMLAAFERWMHAQEAKGWASPAVQECARGVHNALWTCAKSYPPKDFMIAGLAAASKALADAQGTQQPCGHPH